MAEEYDLVVLGGGPGGYVAAIRASQLGMRVAIVEANKLGGTCLHRGCIPSKTLLRSAEIYRMTKEANDFGVITENTTIDFTKIQDRKDKIIQSLHNGIHSLMKKWKIDVYHGYGRILGPSIFSPIPGTISVEYEHGEENTMLIPKNVLIATGSYPASISGLAFDEEYILNSDHLIEMEQLPKSIIIVGGGVIGIEWASMLADFGVEVTVIEYANQILPSIDHEIAREVEKQLKYKGIQFMKSTKILPDSVSKGNSITVDVDIMGEIRSLHAEKMLLSVGRKPNTSDIGIENTNITVNQGYIQTNQYFQTKDSHIYAIGDCIGGLNLAHVASYEGITAVEHMTNQRPFLHNHFPACVYSHPEVATIGLTEKEAIEKEYKVKIGKFPFKAIGKALVHGDMGGFIKIIADEKTDDILGIHIVGPKATELISEGSLAKVLDATPWELASTVHPHPSLSEIIGEAALAVDGLQIHG